MYWWTVSPTSPASDSHTQEKARTEIRSGLIFDSVGGILLQDQLQGLPDCGKPDRLPVSREGELSGQGDGFVAVADVDPSLGVAVLVAKINRLDFTS